MPIGVSIFLFCSVWITMAQLLAQEEKEKTTALKDLLSRIDLDELMKKDEPPLKFPETLDGFEYAFNENGQLRHTETGEPFVFNYKEDLHRWNQKRYEALGEIITKYVYERLEKDCNLKRETLPVDADEDEPKSFIYVSEDALTNPEKLMILIQGSGVVRAGQWARRLIINEDLNSGTQIPFINRAKEEGYGVIVLNPNENSLEVEKIPDPSKNPSPDTSDEPAEKRERKEERDSKKKKDLYEKYRNPQREQETEHIPIRENSTPEEHTLYVWDHFISKSLAKNIYIVAHSYGGLAFVNLMIQREPEVKNRVRAVAMTDSVHNVWHQEANKSIQDWLREHCCNWVSSPEPLDTLVDPMLTDCPRVSAGTEKHELTSWRSFHSIFKFFCNALKDHEDETSSSPVTTRSSHRMKNEDL
ncbi:cotranscriptional regulator FAM172A homolog isoform X1 [Myxocyprinus asiaticus]|uniref:cotranscriptional regulator FAM172A homolog isoform X1 n=1 Tax=Myxocyprinus asiaticus TaxID=70543 RepID=UPI002221BE0E|nr:cotranscriptional regulator FAM172A homolog isoform X1 [Myxocyprinus asiaticus]XP_051512559.1 cotranscriptional regulator FAM172A homolog isoform X1 [Myxocyprinus asiaticus]